MTTLLLAFGAMLTIVGAMAVGVMFGRAPIKGSCGGMSALGIDAQCEICGGNPARCESQSSATPESSTKQKVAEQLGADSVDAATAASRAGSSAKDDLSYRA